MALTAKQEAFCQAIVSGMSQADAYRQAYNAGKMQPASVQVAASRLMADPKVSLRVETLRAPVVAEVQYGLRQAMEECDRALQLAETNKKAGEMVAAIQLRAKLHGLLVERKEIRTGPLDGLSHDELKALNAAIGAIAESEGFAATSVSRTRH